MVNNGNDIGFVQDITGLDKLRQQAVSGKDTDQHAALKNAARQFESIFTSMLFKSMRKANEGFESDLLKSQNQEVYQNMLDEQMSSDLSASGSLGLADMIVKQLGGNLPSKDQAKQQESAIRQASTQAVNYRPMSQAALRQKQEALTASGVITPSSSNRPFDNPQEFVQRLAPYAKRAAKTLGIEPSLLLAQAALETGWGKKVVGNAYSSSNNLFNIKADSSWQGNKVATQTLEFVDGMPVKQQASFRRYPSYAASFDDYVQFLQRNPRYHKTLQTAQNSTAFIHGIHQAGYATDPSYANKVLKVKDQIDKWSN